MVISYVMPSVRYVHYRSVSAAILLR